MPKNVTTQLFTTTKRSSLCYSLQSRSLSRLVTATPARNYKPVSLYQTIFSSANSNQLMTGDKLLSRACSTLQPDNKETKPLANQNNTSPQVSKLISLEPGLVVIKNGLSAAEQQALAKLILERGAHPTAGFWKKDKDGNNILNSTPARGRMFGAVTTFPNLISELCQRNLALAVKADKTLQATPATHAIILYYKTLLQTQRNAYIPWHQDNGENDGKGDYPVVSFALGDSCDFLINHNKPKTSSAHTLANPQNLAHRLLFESGDVLIFGGPCRYVWHAIYTIHPHTAPRFLPFTQARLNVTARYSPEILGKEDRFATKDAAELAAAKSNPFYKLG